MPEAKQQAEWVQNPTHQETGCRKTPEPTATSGHEPATHQRDQGYSVSITGQTSVPEYPGSKPCPPESLVWSLEQPHLPGARNQTQENQNPLACRPSMSISKPDSDLRLAGPWPCPLASQQTPTHSEPKPNCVRNQSAPPALGPLPLQPDSGPGSHP